MGKRNLFYSILLFPLLSIAQDFSGKVIDKQTKQPIETAAVYFDNTTIGTTTNENGSFSISYNDAVQSTLVISYLGYEKVFVSDYRSKNNVVIELIEAENALDEVVIEYDDGLTRKQKLTLFRKEFLGSSKFARSCKILNEDDLYLRYNKSEQSLSVSANTAIKVKNESLGYEIAFEIIDFEVLYKYVNYKTKSFNVHSVSYLGTSFYQPLENRDRKERKVKKNREKAYKGSVQHFMRALYNENLEDEGYHIFHGKFRVNEWLYFNVEPLKEKSFKKIILKDEVSILFNKKQQSKMILKIPEFYVDRFGNYVPIVGVYFSGVMGEQRVGDTLPSDYGLNKKAQN